MFWVLHIIKERREESNRDHQNWRKTRVIQKPVIHQKTWRPKAVRNLLILVRLLLLHYYRNHLILSNCLCVITAEFHFCWSGSSHIKFVIIYLRFFCYFIWIYIVFLSLLIVLLIQISSLLVFVYSVCMLSISQ